MESPLPPSQIVHLPGGGFYSTNPVIDAGTNVEYTCLTVDPTPDTLVYSNVGMKSTIVPLIAESGTISRIDLVWQTKDDTLTPTTNCPPALNNNVFISVASWTCGYGVLRFDLVPTAGGLSMGGLQSSTMTSFVVPLRPGAAGATANPIAFSAPGVNSRLGVICTNNDCRLSITGLTQGQYYMRVRSIYKDASLQIVALDGSGNAISLQGAQAVIDSTGKAQDVLRRIQVRVPLAGSSTNLLSDYAIQSHEAICKRFSAMDGFWSNDANLAVPGVESSTSNALCRPS